MSGPIVRTGTTPEFWKNWDRVFGGKPKKGTSSRTTASAAPVATKAAVPKKAAKKTVKKAAKKK